MIKFLPIVFMIIPFTKILPLNSYNQPYAFLSAFLVVVLWPKAYRRLPQLDRVVLGYMFTLGLVLAMIASFDSFSMRMVQYLLVYVSPVFMVPAAVFAMRSNPDRVRKMVLYGIYLWVGVALVQILVIPDFLVFLASQNDDLAMNVIASGRGVLGLAPEPTHHGLHMLVLGGTLMVLRGPIWGVGLAFGAALFLAQSSFAAMVIGVGALLWTLLRPWRWPALLGVTVVTSAIFSVALSLFGPDSRLGRLLSTFTEFGFAALLNDASANARLYGMSAPIVEAFSNFLMPIGFGLDAWLEMRERILQFNPQINFLSGSGPASGYGLLLVQAGFFALPILAYYAYRLLWKQADTWRGLPAVIAGVVFVGQLYLSTPTFSLLLAAVIYVVMERRDQARSRRSRAVPNPGFT